jgi:hypothetical protein
LRLDEKNRKRKFLESHIKTGEQKFNERLERDPEAKALVERIKVILTNE